MKKKSLLLGNGINNYIGIAELSEANIKERFRKIVCNSSCVFESLFGVKVNYDIYDKVILNINNYGIESLGGVIYKYIKENTTDQWIDNYEIRLQDIITSIALTSIFFTEHGKIKTAGCKEKMFDVSKYDNIFSLNYTEFWDDNKSCKYLHGEFNLDAIKDNDIIYLASAERYNYDKYKNAIEQIKKNSNVIIIDTRGIIYAPEGIPKSNLICVSGIYPSEKIFLAEDLFPFEKTSLYNVLDNIEVLDVFGMSPYGDDSLIEKINKMDYVTVYVYNKDISNETDEWERKLKCKHCLKDSKEII